MDLWKDYENRHFVELPEKKDKLVSIEEFEKV